LSIRRDVLRPIRSFVRCGNKCCLALGGGACLDRVRACGVWERALQQFGFLCANAPFDWSFLRNGRMLLKERIE